VIDNKFFANTSSVTGTKKLNGVTVTVFHDTNPGNHGESDSYYRRDSVGMVYYGSDPGTPLEKQIVPYQIVRFPMTIPSSFQQFNRNGLDFGAYGRDGVSESRYGRKSGVISRKRSPSRPAPIQYGQGSRMTMQIHLSVETAGHASMS
jgi:hypothetical protein